MRSDDRSQEPGPVICGVNDSFEAWRTSRASRSCKALIWLAPYVVEFSFGNALRCFILGMGIIRIKLPSRGLRMRKSLVLVAVVAMYSVVPMTFASGPGEKISHYKGKPSETLSEAVRNFAEYNAKLEILLKGKVDDNAMADVHELTYTLENALGKMNEETAKLAATLEALHQASEKHDREAVLRHGNQYLSVSKEIVK